MAIPLPNKLLDGQMSFEAGVDTYRAPARVPRNQCCLLVNQTTRQDYIGPRPGWTQTPLRFIKQDGPNFVPDPATQSEFETGYFQGMAAYQPDSGPSHLILSISGVAYRANVLADHSVQKVTMADPNDPGNPPNRQVWFQQAELFLVEQDGQSKPLIYDGAKMRRSNVIGSGGTTADGIPLYEVPVGTVMAYSGGRLWVALPDGHSFAAGDGVRGPTGTPYYFQRDSVLKFTENKAIAGGFPFAVPATMGPITAMRPVANLDTSLGQGPLQVYTSAGCFSVNAPFDRTLWPLVTDPIQTVSLLDQGSLSQWATQLVNGDVWYRSLDGIRSFLIARRDFGTWGNRAMSYEVIRHLKDDDQTLLRYCSSGLYDNRLLTTCAPYRVPNRGIAWKGLVALDFIPLTSMQGTEPPCWDGLWTGFDILQILSFESQGVIYCWAAVLGAADAQGVRHIQLWQLNKDQRFDLDAFGVRTRISRVMESPRFDFSPSGSSRLEQKLLETGDIWIDKASGTIDFTLYYRPDEHPCWYIWKRWQICSKTERCASDAVADCLNALNLQVQYRARMGVARPPDNVVSYTGIPSRMGYVFQYRLEIVGDCELTSVRLMCLRNIVEATYGQLPLEMCYEVACCEPGLFLGGPDTTGNSTGQTPPPPPPPPFPLPPPTPTTRHHVPPPPPPFTGPMTPPNPNFTPITPPPSIIPTHNITPDDTPTPITAPNSTCAQLYDRFSITDGGNTYEVGIADLVDLQPGVMAAWSAAVWAAFEGFVAASNLTISAAQIQFKQLPSSGKRWNANQVYLDQFFIGAIGYDWTIIINYCTPN